MKKPSVLPVVPKPMTLERLRAQCVREGLLLSEPHHQDDGVWFFASPLIGGCAMHVYVTRMPSLMAAVERAAQLLMVWRALPQAKRVRVQLGWDGLDGWCE